MTDDRMGGIALIAGSVGSLLTMAFHPSGRDFFVPGQLDSVTRMNIGVHALAIASMPFLFLGALALSRRLSSSRRLGIAGPGGVWLCLGCGNGGRDGERLRRPKPGARDHHHRLADY